MVTNAGTANTSSGDLVRLSFRAKTADDCIQDQTLEELQRRAILEIDQAARDEQTSGSGGGSVQAGNGTIGLGGTSYTVEWTDPFPDTTYDLSIYLTSDPGAPVRTWLSSKSATGFTYNVVGHTKAIAVSYVASPNK
jgi:hypothetical protein